MKTHCVHGHELVPSNAYPNGAHACRTCALDRSRKQYRRPGYNKTNANERSKAWLARRERQNRMIIVVAKRNICSDCGHEFRSKDLHFHHRDPSTKLHEVSQMRYSTERELRDEIRKCDILCQGCHTDAHTRFPREKHAA